MAVNLRRQLLPVKSARHIVTRVIYENDSKPFFRLIYYASSPEELKYSSVGYQHPTILGNSADTIYVILQYIKPSSLSCLYIIVLTIVSEEKTNGKINRLYQDETHCFKKVSHFTTHCLTENCSVKRLFWSQEPRPWRAAWLPRSSLVTLVSDTALSIGFP